MALFCVLCSEAYQCARLFYDHILEKHCAELGKGKWQCPWCLDEDFDCYELLQLHLEVYHPAFMQLRNEEYERVRFRCAFQQCKCHLCGQEYPNRVLLDQHIQRKHQSFYNIIAQIGGGGESDPITFRVVKHAHRGTNVTYGANLKELEPDFASVHIRSQAPLFTILREWVSLYKNIKIYAQFFGKFHKNQDENVHGFTTFCHSIHNPTQIATVYKLLCDNLTVQLEDYTYLKSGWILDNILKFSFTVLKDRALAGSSFIKTPFPFTKKKSIVNINNGSVHPDNRHNKCFLWSVLAHDKFLGSRFKASRNRLRQATNVKNYIKHENDFDCRGITFPMTLEQIPKFEKQNPQLSFTVLCYEIPKHEPQGLKKRDEFNAYIRKNVHLVYNSEEMKSIHVDLLLLCSTGGRCHWTLVGGIESLIGLHTRKGQICRNCLQSFTSRRTLIDHQEWCLKQQFQQVFMPDEDDNVMKFNRFAATVKVPFLLFGDFESFLPKLVSTRNTESRTFLTSHIPSGYAWTVTGPSDEILHKKVHRVQSKDENPAYAFVNEILEIAKKLDVQNEKYQREAIKTMIISEKDLKCITKAKTCCLCYKPLSVNVGKETPMKPKTRHHAHLPPYNFVGMSHNFCNLQARKRVVYPLFMHNSSNYDNHFLVRALTELKKQKIINSVEIIPKSTEKFLTITINNKIRILDSLQFTFASLDSLVESTPKEKLKLIREEFASEIKNGADVQLLQRKGIYPYSYMTDVSKFNEELPPPTAFYSDLTEEDISEEDYEHVQKIWSSFKMKTLGDLHNVYVRSDVALLGDVIINLRNLLFNNKKYGLDLAQYFTLPMVSRDAMLKLTGVEIELLTDPTMHCWVESAIRGGFCGVQSQRSCKANNKYMHDYDPEKPSTFIAYYDATNLYGKCMSEKLPISDYEWVNDPMKAYEEALLLTSDSDFGFMLEVDTEIDGELHNKFNDLPPLPIKRVISEEEWSESYQRTLADDIHHKGSGVPKLVADLHNKKNYILHHSTLQLYTKLGVKITKVHRVLKFTQSDFIKKYIDINTANRNNADSDLEKDFWKLMSNVIFGKMIEQVRDRQRVNIVLDEDSALRLTRKPTFQRIEIIDEGCTLHIMRKTKVKLDRPILTGVAILEYAKQILYNMHYNGIHAFYGDKAKLMYTDTDSLIYQLETPDMYADMLENSYYFDTHQYSGVFKKYQSDHNKKVLAKFKDETPNKVITQFVALKAKMYALETFSPDINNFCEECRKINSPCNCMWGETKKAKGVGKRATKTQLSIQDYVNCVETHQQKYVDMRTIQSLKQNLYTLNIVKKSCDPLDDKRFWVDFRTSLAYGHKDCNIYE